MSDKKSVMQVQRHGTHGHYTCVLPEDLDAIELFVQLQKAAIQAATAGMELVSDKLDQFVKERDELTAALTLAKAERDSYQRVGISTMEKLVSAQDLLLKGGQLIKSMAKAVQAGDDFDDFEQEVEDAEELGSRMIAFGKGEHILYRNGDNFVPEAILDRNGQVALDQCMVCGKGEAELSGPCEGK